MRSKSSKSRVFTAVPSWKTDTIWNVFMKQYPEKQVAKIDRELCMISFIGNFYFDTNQINELVELAISISKVKPIKTTKENDKQN